MHYLGVIFRNQRVNPECRQVPSGRTFTVLEPFREDVNKLCQNSVAPNTANLYQNDVSTLENFKYQYKLPRL